VQQRQITAWAALQGWQLAEVVVERGISGSVHVGERPQGGKLMGRLERGDVLIVSKLDRLFRSALDALQTVDQFKQRGISLVLIDLGGDVCNGLAKMFLTIAAAFAEAERDRIRERIQGVKADQRSRGRYLGGIMPFGYRLAENGALEPIEDQQRAIAEMHRMRAAGASLRAISAAMKGIGHDLSHEAVRAILARQSEVPAEA
jgi:DNA invertase Pin-like site-specific DNA recombinase